VRTKTNFFRIILRKSFADLYATLKTSHVSRLIYLKDKTTEETGVIMDWELKFTDIADCEVVKISNVLRPGKDQGITIVIDTEGDTFRFIPELITMDNAPLWLYNAAHGTNIRGCEACVR
jgi:hypothetical protein